MISPERLRRYPFFSFLDADQLRELAIITTERALPARTTLFEIGEPAVHLFFLEEGSIELHYVVADEREPRLRKDFLVGSINPGEVLAISAVLPSSTLTATAYAPVDSRLLEIEGTALRALSERDPRLACGLLEQVARAAMERLHATRVLLAAASAPL